MDAAATGGWSTARVASAQLLKFCAVGATGYVVNLAVYAGLVHGARVHFIAAAVCSFLVAVTNNYTWNRLWTFRAQRGDVAVQGIRFLAVSVLALCANVVCLALLVGLGLGKVPAQATAIVVVAPLNFIGNKLWTFSRSFEPSALLARLVALVDREAFLVPMFALYAFALARLAPYELHQDSWLTLVAGREVAEHGLPERDTLTVFSRGEEWIDQQWLAHLAFYGVFLVGGLKAVLFSHAVLVTGAFSLALVAARRLGASSRSVFWVAAASIFLAPWTWQMRSQSFAYVFFVAVAWLLARDSRTPSRRVFLVFPLLVLWANLHGSVVLGAALVALRGLTFGVEQIRSSERRRGWVTRSFVLVGAPALCLLASPYGLSLVGYYRRMLVDPAFARIVTEWQPPTFPRAFPFFVLALAAVWLLSRGGGRLPAFDKLALTAMIAGGFLAMRNITWFGFAAVLMLPPALDAVWPMRSAGRGHGRPIRLLARASAVALPVALLTILVLPSSTYEKMWPRAAARAVASAANDDPSVRVFASDRYADWLLWNEPELAGRVAFDVRFELHSDKELESIFAYRNRVGADWSEAADGYGVIVIDRTAERELERDLLRRPGSRRLYADRLISVLYRPA